MPSAPPARPHSTSPHVSLSLNPSLFPRPSTPSGSRSSSDLSKSFLRGESVSSLRQREAEWDDAWDSSSDKEDGDDEDGDGEGEDSLTPGRSPSPSASASAGSPVRAGRDGQGVAKSFSQAVSSAIPIRGAGSVDPNRPVHPHERDKERERERGISSSWASSFQHVSLNSSPSRPALPSSKTYTEGAPPPQPGTSLATSTNGSPATATRGATGAGASKLPPGGAWEIVESRDCELGEEVVSPPKVGPEVVRSDVDEILRDPLQLLSTLSLSTPSTPIPSTPNPASSFPFLPASSGPPTPSSTTVTDSEGVRSQRKDLGRQRSVRTERRREKFAKVLRGRVEDGGGVEVAELRRLAWSGIPDEVRPIAWQLLLNYLPLPTQPRLTTLSRKRKEYAQLVDQHFSRGLGALDQQIWHQIEIDVPRTRPGTPLWSCITAQRALERILYVWAIRHPASGYVQGINDLVTPFFQVFLSAYIDTDPEMFDVGHLPAPVLSAIEADSFWCLSKLLDGIQDNYISQQPGIQRLVKRMGELVKRIDAPLAAHFEEQGVEYLQFAFRWMNCLLMREMSLRCTIRMWDTYLAEGTDAFSQFHLYVCSALLVKYSERLREMDFQEIIIFLQRLPTHAWTDHDVELLLSEAYVLKTVWQGAENHFANMPNGQSGGFGMLGR
ncbi:GTPase-activating protein [Saitozyma sp. JCM 24511]|nr:GTPase-activating protein [Saitozyma sp. JCM 24511]